MSRAGTYVDNLTGEATYQSFKPNPLPPMPKIKMNEEMETTCKTRYCITVNFKCGFVYINVC